MAKLKIYTDENVDVRVAEGRFQLVEIEIPKQEEFYKPPRRFGLLMSTSEIRDGCQPNCDKGLFY